MSALRLGNTAAALLALGVVVLDQATKAMVRAWLPLGSAQPLWPGLLSITHGRNRGLAFGVLSHAPLPNQALLLGLLQGTLLCVLAFMLWRLPREAFRGRLALALAIGGALGNLVDRFRLGFVTDFIHFYWGRWVWPDFNVADSAISVGITLLILGGTGERPPAPEPSPPPPPA